MAKETNEILKESEHNLVKIYTKQNNYIFDCKILSIDGDFIKFYDLKKKIIKFIALDHVSEIEILKKDGGKIEEGD